MFTIACCLVVGFWLGLDLVSGSFGTRIYTELHSAGNVTFLFVGVVTI